MNDIRLAVGVTDHPKTIRLIRKCGEGAYRCLQRLWLYARIYSPDGSLAGLDPEAVEIAAGWNGEMGLFYVALKEIGWLDPDGGLHDWEEHQGWACGQKKRTRRAKEAAKARWEKRFNGASDAGSNANAQQQAESSNAPSPIPSPSPSPKHKDQNHIVGQARLVIDLLNEKTCRSFRHTPSNLRKAAARLKEGYSMDDFAKVFESRSREWGNDPKMAEYLRPDTLLGTKFDSYLQAAGKSAPASGIDPTLKLRSANG